MGALSRAACWMRPRAATLLAMSKTNGVPPRTGAAKAIGLLPMVALGEPGKPIIGGVRWHTNATRPFSAACSANIPSAERWPQLEMMPIAEATFSVACTAWSMA
jgi:hypothetical protein